ncbi:MAG: hypothetical protein JXA99_02510 [Candidatus Lokiarchaeota archaeon]|nr:hypothetical protein [Candidatus Lokiarchaeota archaeon]
MFGIFNVFLIILISGFFLSILISFIESKTLGTIFDIISFIGIILHELSHYTMCLLMGIVPSEIHMSYKNMSGYVLSKKGTFMQGFLISLAPLFIGSYIAWFCLDFILSSLVIWYYRLLAFIVVISILIAAGPSYADIKCLGRSFNDDIKKSLGQIAIVVISSVCVWFITKDIAIPEKFSFLYFIYITIGYFLIKYLILGILYLSSILGISTNSVGSICHNNSNTTSISICKPKRKKRKRELYPDEIAQNRYIDLLDKEKYDRSEEDEQSTKDAMSEICAIDIILRSGKKKKIKIKRAQW